jgi:DNA-directed RNA polymerase subunit M/transcription elongation factor TFIIS
MKCACCGGMMIIEKETEKTMTLKCEECGLSDSKIKPQD